MDEYIEQPLLAETKAGMSVKGNYLVREASIRQTRRGDTYLEMSLCDRSGEVDAKFWDYNPDRTVAVESGAIIRILAQMQEYRGARQIVIRKFRLLSPEEADPRDFLPSTPKDIDALEARLREIVASVESEPIRALLLSFLDDEGLMSQFRQAPAAMRLHHAYLGGLLEHTVSVCETTLALCDRYGELRRDLLIAGAMLHDIGKTREMSWSPVIRNTNRGGLIGHIAMGVVMVEEKAREIPDFSGETLDHICHLILSHHGRLEFGSPRMPATREAIVLHHVDNIDAKLAGVDRVVQEHGDSPDEWSNYQNMFEGRLFLG